MSPRRLTYAPAGAMTSVSAWMRQTVASGQPITAEHVLSWASAFDAAAERAREIVAQCAVDPTERVDAAYADLLVTEGSNAIRVLAGYAAEAATRAELILIDQTSVGLISALEALAHGVARRQPNTQQGA